MNTTPPKVASDPENAQTPNWQDRLFRLIGLLVIALSLGGGWLLMDYRNALDMPLRVADEGTIFTVQPGQSLHRVAEDLAMQDVLDHPWYLVIHGRLAGKAGQIKVGEYLLTPGLTPRSLLDLLVTGKVTQYSFTIVEGWSFRQLREAMARVEVMRHTLADKDDAAVMTALDHPDEHPEGRFLPDTYYFPRGTTDVAFLRRAYQALAKTLATEWAARDQDLPYQNPYDALIMASIVEKETGVPAERGEIAGVFVRRLQKGMRLQTDPTIIYGLGDAFDGNLTRSHLQSIDNRYNTYQHDGLPPTPIALPGKAAIHAVLHPAAGDSLYFVSRGDGTHQFSATLTEHNRAVSEFQLSRKSRPDPGPAAFAPGRNEDASSPSPSVRSPETPAVSEEAPPDAR